MTYRIDKPSRDPEADFDVAVAKRKMIKDRQTLRSARDQVLGAYKKYETEGGQPSSIVPIKSSKEILAVLRDNYNLTYGASLGPLRDEILASSSRRLCPMCSKGSVATLDHYLPKDSYPEYSILCLNLIPACTNCNSNKSNIVGDATGGRFFHAYYDRLPHETPLWKADVFVEERSVVTEFYVNPELPEPARTNAAFHFDKLQLNEQYATGASLELWEMLPNWQTEFDLDGSAGVRQEALRIANRMRQQISIHYWKFALHEAVSRSHDFCAGGFRRLT
jgi:hypothetical protein